MSDRPPIIALAVTGGWNDMAGRHYSAQLISDFIGAIYDCVLDASRWHAVVDNIRAELGFCYAVLGVYPLPQGQILLGVSSGIEAVKLEELAVHGRDIVDLWGGDDRIRQYPLEEPILQSDVVPNAALVASRYFIEWAQPQGVVDAVAIGLERNGDRVSLV